MADENEITNTMSERDYMGKAIDLVGFVDRDYSELIAGRLKLIFPDTLKIRLDCYVVAHANYEAMVDRDSAAKKEWDAKAPVVKDLKDVIIHDARFIMREMGKKDEVKYLNKIAVGVGHRDLCMDSMELSKFCERHEAELVSGNFNMDLAAEMKQSYDLLSNLLEDLNKAPAEVKEAEIILRKAFTWLHEAVSEIRKYGQHIFWRDERLDDYKSDHFQNL